jgi:hypothetical protein
MNYRNDLQTLLERGYAVISDSAAFVTLERPKRFSVAWFLFWCLFGGVGGLVYIAYYVLMPKRKITLAKGRSQ